MSNNMIELTGKLIFVAASKDDDDGVAKLQETLASTTLVENPNVSIHDVVGLDFAKGLLYEATNFPVDFPGCYSRTYKPINTILLYGPPGTGKTHLVKAVATATGAAFFSTSASKLLSKYRYIGGPELFVEEIFTMARASKRGFSIVFIDGLDSLCDSKVDNGDKRRLLAQLSREMNSANNNGGRVLVLGETRAPWNLDDDVRQLFQERIYIALPNADARARMIQVHLGDTPHNLTATDFIELGNLTLGASGSDMKRLVHLATTEVVRQYRTAEYFRMGEDGLYRPCQGCPRCSTIPSCLCLKCGAKRTNMWQYVPGESYHVSAVTTQEFKSVLERPDFSTLSPEQEAKFDEWSALYGTKW